MWEALHPDSTRRNPADGIGYGKPPVPEASFASDTQRITGEDQRRTREHLRRAEALGPDLHAVIGTSLDNDRQSAAAKR